MELSDRINAGFEERQRARDEAMDRGQELMDEYNRMQEGFYRVFQKGYGVG